MCDQDDICSQKIDSLNRDDSTTCFVNGDQIDECLLVLDDTKSNCRYTQGDLIIVIGQANVVVLAIYMLM